jgi:hypothetical protein
MMMTRICTVTAIAGALLAIATKARNVVIPMPAKLGRRI